MTVPEFLERKARRSDATKVTYSKADLAFAKCFGVESTDVVVHRVKAHRLDRYKALDKFVAYLLANGNAPKTVLTYLFRYEEITLDNYPLRAKVVLHPHCFRKFFFNKLIGTDRAVAEHSMGSQLRA